MDKLVQRNIELWNDIEVLGYRIDQFPIRCLHTNQQSVPAGEVEKIKTLYRSRLVRVAPPTAFICPDDPEKIIIFDGNKRTTAMLDLIRDEGYISTDKGLYPAEEAYAQDCGIYIDCMPLAIIIPHGIPGYQLHPIHKTQRIAEV